MTNPLPPTGLRKSHFLVVLGLFLIWGNSFIATAHLLGAERAAAQFDWRSLAVARCGLIAPFCLLYYFFFRRAEAFGLLRRFPVRLGVGSLLAVPGYNLSLFFGQQHGVPPSVAAVTTALLPLFVAVLAATFLGERLGLQKVLGFLVALIGLLVIAASKGGVPSFGGYGFALGVTVAAPLQFAVYSILSKPAMESASPLSWSYLTIGLGGLPLTLAIPWIGGPELAVLGASGWAAVLYLAVLCTLLGYAVWCWLLQRLPASSVGFTVFLNPPATTASKALLALLFPTVFVWRLGAQEWLGGGLALSGLALALWPFKGRRASSTGTELAPEGWSSLKTDEL